MPYRRRYSEQQFRAALSDPDVHTTADLCRSLGLVPRGGNYESLREFGRDLGLDTELTLAWRRLGCIDEQLVAAMSEPLDVARVLVSLGVDDTSRARLIVRERIHQLGLSPWTYAPTLTDHELRAALADPGIDSYYHLCEVLRLRPLDYPLPLLRERAYELQEPIPERWSVDLREPRSYPVDELRKAVAASDSLAATIRALGDKPSRASYSRVKRDIRNYGLETSHFKPHALRPERRRRPLEEVLVYGPLATTSQLRKRLVDEGLKGHRCEACSLARWRGQPIPLELDHVDGDRRNNRLENLRLLCPNCHALTPTYRGRNIRNGTI